MRPGTVALVTVALLVATPLLEAQSNVATGTLGGIVIGPGGDALPGAGVEAANVATGLRRAAVTSTLGAYRIDLLPPGTYDVSAALAGFTTEIRKGVHVGLGSSVRIDLAMQLSPVQAEIVVMAEAPLVETTNPSVAATVNDTAIADLPLYGRDFTDLVLLTPAATTGRSGTVDGTQEIDGGRGGVNLGTRAVNNSFNVDGTNSQSSFFGDQRGGARSPFTFSQAAIKEQQAITSSYSLQHGSSGGVINAVTRSGSNELHGEVFAYYADDSFFAANALGERADDFTQAQYGLALGGPLVRDRAHYFASYDGQDHEHPTFRQFRGFPEGREADWEDRTGLDWERETGTIMQTRDAHVLLLKLDWQLSASHLLVVRDNWLGYEGDNQADSYPTSGRSKNGTEDTTYNSFVASLNFAVSENGYNELILQHAREERPGTPNVTSVPQATIAWSEGNFGQNYLLPKNLVEERLQLIDNLSWELSGHTLKAGVNVELVEFDNHFLENARGRYKYLGWQDFLDNGTPEWYRQGFAENDGRLVFSADYYAAYLQDEWQPAPEVTLTWGLRYSFQDNDDPVSVNPLYPLTGQIPDDRDNWAPRVGFAWDLRGDGKQVLRGGAGYFYDKTSAALVSNAMMVNGIEVTQVLAWCEDVDYCPTYPDRWSSLSDLTAITPSIYAFDPGFESPETLRFTLGYERETLPDLAVGVNLVYSETRSLERRQDQNLEPTGELTVDGRTVYRRGTVHPELGQVVLHRSDAGGRYRAVVLTARKRFSRNWFLNASYTWSRAEDNDSSELSFSQVDHRPEDQYNLEADWGPSNYDIEHKLVASASWHLPMDFMVGAIVFIRSGFPYSARHAGDLNGDGLFYTERAVVEVAPGLYQHFPRNTERQPWFRTVNLRLSKTFRLGASLELEILGEAFNVFGNDNWYVSRSSQVLSSGCYLDGDEWEPCRTWQTFGREDIPGSPRSYQVGAKLRF